MPISVVVGAQWGDEGKGKVVDYLSQNVDVTVRFQGGDNAGHTVLNEHGCFKLHLIPCGIFNDKAFSLVGTGMVVNPDVLLEEIKELNDKGIKTDNLRISGRAHILMPYHCDMDSAFEGKKTSIGTTKRGIGPAYADRAFRFNLRFEDLLDMDYVKEHLEINLERVNSQLTSYGLKTCKFEEMYDKCAVWHNAFKDIIVDAHEFLYEKLEEGKKIMFEGQLGTMKDLDLGIYPYVTASNPVAAYASVSSGIPMKYFDNVIGVVKAFSSAVGKGPFPTEISEDEAVEMRGTGGNIDDEFGARTGRPRRLGWLDIPIVKFSHRVNGFRGLAVCKLDKLDEMREIKLCTGYKKDGNLIKGMPNTKDLYKVEPIYETMDGWMCSTRNIDKYENLPENAKKYLKRIEELVGTEVLYIGIGPERNDIIKID